MVVVVGLRAADTFSNFFLWIFGYVWSLWDGSGSSIESC